MYPCVYCSTIHNSQGMKQPKFDRWLDKDVVHICDGILLSHKNDEILPLATTWMDLESIMLSEVRRKRTRTI